MPQSVSSPLSYGGFNESEPYICAITLAGAAEEILGKALPPHASNALQELIGRIKLQHPNFVLLDRKVEDMQDADICGFLNRTKNLLKHAQIDANEIAPEEDAIAMIARALTNYISLGLPFSITIQRGVKLLTEYAKP